MQTGVQNGSQEAADAACPGAQQNFIALVDLSSNEEFLELAKSALLAAIESLPPNACLGLITFSTKVRSSRVEPLAHPFNFNGAICALCKKSSDPALIAPPIKHLSRKYDA